MTSEAARHQRLSGVELASADALLQAMDAVEPEFQAIERDHRHVMCDALVLDARLRQSLVTMRSLGHRGLHVAGLEVANNIETSASVPAFWSRWCEQQFRAPSFELGAQPFLTYLDNVIRRTGASVLITSSDGTLEVMRQARHEIEGRARLALAKEPALRIATNKVRTLEIARRLGIRIPQGVPVGSASEVPAALREIGLPAVVKPVESWVWGEQQAARLTCKLVTTPGEARRAVEELTKLGGSTIVQQFLSGRREAVSFLYAGGEVHARFAQWAKRTQPPLGGTSVLRQSIAVPPDIGDQAERLVREIELEGYSEVEFRRDQDGRPYLMEINPRLSASVEVAVRAGVDFPLLLYQWAKGDRIDRVTGYRVGGWMRDLRGDIQTTIQSFLERGRPGVAAPGRAVFDFLSSFCIFSGYDQFDWGDPLPAWAATMDFVHYARQWLVNIL
jgi:predicted ATP-grasp superfamily ATP-dependent carboligase